MFKAKTKNPKQKRTFRKRDDNSDEEDNNDNPPQESQTIEKVKKKRKLLTELQFKKGTDAASLLKARGDDDNGDEHLSKKADATTTASSSQEGIMEKKHKQALEQYVESKLADLTGGGDKQSQQSQQQPSNKKLTKDELYKEIAQACQAMVGRTAADDKEDGDVGTGGAMLVAGTGLAEVILPVEERLKAVQATEEAQLPHPIPSIDKYGMPVSQVPIPAGAARFQVSAADRHRHFAESNTGAGASVVESRNRNSIHNPDVPKEAELDRERMGFEALRGKPLAAASGETGGGDKNKSNKNNNNHSNKDYRNRASDDKVYGNFLKHHRENQWRGGK